MFALIRFLNQFDNRPYIISTSNILDFKPSNEEDYDKNCIYSVYWEDKENPENTGTYSSQILLMAYTEEALENKRSRKRLRKTIVHPSDLETEDDAVPTPDKVTAKQGKKRLKDLQQTSKSTAYERILQEQLLNAQAKNCNATSATREPPKRRRILASDSGSDTDESVVSATELKNAKKDAAYWRHRYGEVSAENSKLTCIIETMQETIDVKLATIQQLLESQGSVVLPKATEDHHGSSQAALPAEEPAPSSGQIYAAEEREQVDLDCITPSPSHSVPKTTRQAPTWNLFDAFSVEEVSATMSDPQAEGKPKFSDIGGGRYHVNRGTTIGSSQADRIMKHTKPTMVAKDMAQAIWGRVGLARRTYGGKVAPKDKQNQNVVVRKELSPFKVGLVIETVQHWGLKNKVPVQQVVANMSTVMSQKIQDSRKALRRLGFEDF
uniref:BEN domain-containing protein n=1 Tax=Ixodes ricinus TaxID=34613 RepID=A0A147BAF1_IXORI